MRILIGAAALLAISPCLAAQKVEGPTQQRHRRQINENIERMRRSIDEGIPVRTNVRVTIWLRNDHRLKGVVKNGRFVEKPSGLDFVSADKETVGAGIRVWYYDNTDSYIFLPFEAIARYKIGSRLTRIDIEKIEKDIAQRREIADRKRREAMAKLKASGKNHGKKGEEDSEASTDDLKKRAEEERLLALLAEFPPEAGWGPEKIKEIERRKIVIGAYPDEESKRFIEIFDQWEQALEIKERRDAERAETQGVESSGGKGEQSKEPPPEPKKGY